MPTWDDYKAHAISRGALAFEIYIAESTPSESGPAVPEILPDHLAYQRELEIAGKLAFAGPVSDDTGMMMEGTGMIVYRAESLQEAQDLASNDPMHLSGARTFTLRRWMINEGSLQVSMGFSTQQVSLS